MESYSGPRGGAVPPTHEPEKMYVYTLNIQHSTQTCEPRSSSPQLGALKTIQEYLAHQKQKTPRTPQRGFKQGPMVVIGKGCCLPKIHTPYRGYLAHINPTTQPPTPKLQHPNSKPQTRTPKPKTPQPQPQTLIILPSSMKGSV